MVEYAYSGDPDHGLHCLSVTRLGVSSRQGVKQETNAFISVFVKY